MSLNIHDLISAARASVTASLAREESTRLEQQHKVEIEELKARQEAERSDFEQALKQNQEQYAAAFQRLLDTSGLPEKTLEEMIERQGSLLIDANLVALPVQVTGSQSQEGAAAIPASESLSPAPKRRGRPPKVKPVESDPPADHQPEHKPSNETNGESSDDDLASDGASNSGDEASVSALINATASAQITESLTSDSLVEDELDALARASAPGTAGGEIDELDRLAATPAATLSSDADDLSFEPPSGAPGFEPESPVEDDGDSGDDGDEVFVLDDAETLPHPPFLRS